MKRFIIFSILVFFLLSAVPVLSPKLVETRPAPAIIDHTPSTETICSEGTCISALYSGTTFVFEDKKWKNIEDARDLKPYFIKEYLEKDPNFDIEIAKLNYTYIELNLSFNWSNWENISECKKSGKKIKCDFKFKTKETWYDENMTKHKYEEKFTYKWEMKEGEITKEKLKWKIKGNPFNKTYTFGGNSTTIKLSDPNTEFTDDSYVHQSVPYKDTNFGTHEMLTIDQHATATKRFYTRINLSSLPKNINVQESILSVYLYEVSDLPTEHIDVNVTHIFSNVSWNETEITWTNQPCGIGTSTIFAATKCNKTQDTIKVYQGLLGRRNFTVTDAVRYEVEQDTGNISFIVHYSPLTNTSYAGSSWASKEHTADPTRRPYLNITYEQPYVNFSSVSTNMTNNTIVKHGDLIEVRALWTANQTQNISFAWIHTNGTGSKANQSFTYYNGLTGSQTNWTNITFSTKNFTEGYFYVQLQANDTSEADNTTGRWYWEMPELPTVLPSSMSRTLNQTEQHLWNITVKNTGILDGYYNFSCRDGQICNVTKFNISFENETLFVLSSGKNATNEVNLTATTDCSLGTYYGNISVMRINDTREFNITLTYTVATKFGVPDIINSSLSLTMYSDELKTEDILVNNTGALNATFCNFSVSGTLDSYVYYNLTNFNITPAITKWARITIDNPPVDLYFESLKLECEVNGSGYLSSDSIIFVVDSNARPSPAPSGGGGPAKKEIVEVEVEVPVEVPYCGDGNCDVGEDIINCPVDCRIGPTMWKEAWFVQVLAAVMVIVVAYSFFVKNQKKRKKGEPSSIDKGLKKFWKGLKRDLSREYEV